MNEPSYDLICIGCGPAGEKAATQAAYYGRSVAIVEKAPRPGGAMVNTGTIPSKALRETALLCSAFKRRSLPGVSFSLDHGLSVARFMARRHLLEQQEHDRIEDSMDRHRITVHHGAGRLIDPHHVAVVNRVGRERVLHGTNMLIATGSSPVRPDHVPFDHPRVLDADDVLNMPRIPRSMIIVGGGVIGCEYASIFAELSVKVTIIHPRDTVLDFLDAEIRANLMDAMRSTGVAFALNESVKSVDVPKPGADEAPVRVTTDRGRTLEAEALLWAAGRRSNVDGLGLEDAGVEMDARGRVIVDASFRTRVPSIYAAGDVIGFPALASTSMEQGRIAACRMFNIAFKTRLAETVPIGLYTIPAVSMVGASTESALASARRVAVGRATYRYNVRGRMLGDEQGLLKCVFDADTRALLGAAIIGESATELIHLGQFAIANDLGIDDFIDACFNYPSLSELYKYASYDALQAIADDAARAA